MEHSTFERSDSASSEMPHASTANLAMQYIRLSAKPLDQRHSYSNQSAVIGEFAKVHGLKIIRTYLDDDSASNSKVARPAQKRLIEDIGSGRCECTKILIYDISRLGHLSDSNFCTEIEQIFREAGIQIVCCAAEILGENSFVEEIAMFRQRVMGLVVF